MNANSLRTTCVLIVNLPHQCFDLSPFSVHLAVFDWTIPLNGQLTAHSACSPLRLTCIEALGVADGALDAGGAGRAADIGAQFPGVGTDADVGTAVVAALLPVRALFVVLALVLATLLVLARRPPRTAAVPGS